MKKIIQILCLSLLGLATSLCLAEHSNDHDKHHGQSVKAHKQAKKLDNLLKKDQEKAKKYKVKEEQTLTLQGLIEQERYFQVMFYDLLLLRNALEQSSGAEKNALKEQVKEITKLLPNFPGKKNKEVTYETLVFVNNERISFSEQVNAILTNESDSAVEGSDQVESLVDLHNDAILAQSITERVSLLNQMLSLLN